MSHCLQVETLYRPYFPEHGQSLMSRVGLFGPDRHERSQVDPSTEHLPVSGEDDSSAVGGIGQLVETAPYLPPHV